MKTQAIKESIINNYRILAKKSNKQSIVWGLNYRPENRPVGYVNALGEIRRNKAKIEIRNDEVSTIKKPFFSTWNKTLKKINVMLENIIFNFDNPEVVSQKYLNVLCFKKDYLDKLSKIAENIR